MKPIKNSQQISDEKNGIFKSDDEIRNSISMLSYTDLFVIGKIWIEAMRTVLIGTKFNLIPVVNAMGKPAKEDRVVTKPKPMKFEELPIYEKPHSEYKSFIEDEKKCAGYNDMLIHKALLPHVKESRRRVMEMSKNLSSKIKDSCKNTCASVNDSKRRFKEYMRHPDNTVLRQGVVVAGVSTGFLLGGGGGIPKRVLFTSVGALAAGSLCFPRQTDEYFRNVCYHTAKVVLAVYNTTCGKNITLRERIACKDDLPSEPKPKKSYYCK